ncbi:MAG TPA: wax ester/triacylglycerol synthase domain-containing protein, partial [Burkholderiaceae bacterium]|nr:wax ester/triacylglycerol synthase domain-containing protein [Burkholderiaceae bacterium]
MTTIDSAPLTSVDTAWLRMDRPTNLMMICGMMMFAERLDLREVKETIRSRMLCFHRFLQRVAMNGAGAHWENDPHFSLDWHVRHIALPDSPGGDSLESVISDLISTPLDSTKPMWQWHLIDTADGGSTLFLRIHHCYGDGFALTHVVASMTDIDPDKPHMPAPDLDQHDTRHTAWERIFGPVTEVVGDVMRSARSVIDLGYDWMTTPSHALDYGKRGIDFATAAAIIASMAPDSYTRFKGPLGVMKRAAWAESLSLFEVKAVAEAFGASVNDVLLACVAGALRDYLLEQDDSVEGIEVRALVPVNLRPPGPVTELGNRFSL